MLFYQERGVFNRKKNATRLQTHLQLPFMWLVMTTSLMSLKELQSTTNETYNPFGVNVNHFYSSYYNLQINTYFNILF